MHSDTLIGTALAPSMATSLIRRSRNSGLFPMSSRCRDLLICAQLTSYNLNPNLLHLVQRKYCTYSNQPVVHDPNQKVVASSADTYGRYPSGITFDRFVRACVVIKQLTEAFRRLDVDRDGWIRVDYDQFMTTVLTLP